MQCRAQYRARFVLLGREPIRERAIGVTELKALDQLHIPDAASSWASSPKSLLAAFFSLVGIAVLAANSLNHLAPLVFLGSAHYLSAFETTQLQTLALLSLKMHARGYSIAGVFFGSYCLMIGYLALRSGFLPRILGVLMAIGGLGYLTNSFASFLSPTLAARLPDFAVLGGIAELSLCLWLMVMGVNALKWEEKASAWQIRGA